jgi:hypothetical protein
MHMSERDEFPEGVKRVVAFRAGHQCSFEGCTQRTSGPSNESDRSVTNVGDVAHIVAASPGGRRSDASMTAEERKSIGNAIWMCATHARLVDRDEILYTVESLRRMKLAREAAAAAEVRERAASGHPQDLIAVGPDVICTGSLLSLEESEWRLGLTEFLVGDFVALVSYIDRFSRCDPGDRYVLMNELGDGRVLTSALGLNRTADGLVLRCPVATRFPRERVQDLGVDFAISEATDDLFIENGTIAEVSGLDALPQRIRSCLSMGRGKVLFHSDFGVRFDEFFEAFRNTPWLDRLMKLEVIRQAAIPYHDALLGRGYTPLQCVERVRKIEVISCEATNGRIPIRCELDVAGIGRWTREIASIAPGTRQRELPTTASP